MSRDGEETSMDNEQHWYLLDGSEVLLLEMTPSGCIVERIYEGDQDREPLYSKPFVVDAIFSYEHFIKEHPEVTKKREELASLSEKLTAIRAEIKTAEAQRPAILAKLKQIPALAGIEDFIEDRVTHFVHSDYAHISVMDRSVLEYTEDGRSLNPKKFRLLSLYGSSKGDLSWNLNEYYDGSGRTRYQVWPFTSLEAAKEFARGLLMEKMTKLADDRNPNYLLESFRKCGLEAPQELVDKVLANKRANKEERVKRLRVELEQVEAE